MHEYYERALMVIVAKPRKVIVRLHDAFEDIRFSLDKDVRWFDNAVPHVENCFEFLRKRAMSTRDLVKLFGFLWPNIDPEMKEKEFLQRLTIIIRTNYVFSLSSAEYFLKNVIKASKSGPLVDWLQEKTEEAKMEDKIFWMYLTNIMKESKRKKLITKTQHKNWDGLAQLRNVIIHNNGVFERSRVIRIGGVKITAEAGEQIDTKLINYPKFMRTLIRLTRAWIEKYLVDHEF
ncbi:MAG: hypothetical protein ACFFFC_04055 [Candidatus Thorarchaeota archaeon]